MTNLMNPYLKTCISYKCIFTVNLSIAAQSLKTLKINTNILLSKYKVINVNIFV